MKHPVKKFKSLEVALKELEPFIRNGAHLQTGKPFKKLGDMRSREVLANWLICVVNNAEAGRERLTFTSDPTGGDGIIYELDTEYTWQTEHVMVPRAPEGAKPDIQALIFDAVKLKQEKGGAAYASGKTLVVFVEAGGEVEWFPNRVAKALPKNDFSDVWVVGLQRVEDGAYVYGVTQLDVSGGNAPAWTVGVSPDFTAWDVKRLQ